MDAGLVAIEIYYQQANAHERAGLLDERSHRPVRAEEHRRAARKLRKAAKAERVNPPVETWNP